MSTYNRLIATAFVALLCSPLSLCGQEESICRLDINEILNLADSQSTSIRCFDINKDAAEEAIKVAKAQRLPDVSTSLSLSYWGKGYISNRDFNNWESAYIPNFGNNFILKVNQTIYSGGAISSGINLAELNNELAYIDRDENRKRIKFLLIGYYLQLTQLSNQINVFEQNILLTQRLIEIMHSRRKEGTIINNDITRYELQLENLKLMQLKISDRRNIVNHQLATVIGKPLHTKIIPKNSLEETLVPIDDESKWQHLASLESFALKKADIDIKIKLEHLKVAKSERLPKISLFAEEHFDGPIVIEVPAIDKNFNYWYVGIGISYNISSLFKDNKKINQSKIESQYAKERFILAQEQVRNDIHEAYIKYKTSQLELKTQTKSVELANQNYKVVNNRYLNDLALITDMLDAANSKLNAELNLANSQIDVIYNYYKMLFITNSL